MPTVGLRALASVMGILVCLTMSAACDGNQPSGHPDNSSQPGTVTSSPPPPSPSQGDLVPLPADVEVQADWDPSGDAVTDAAVLAAVNAQRAQWAVMAAGDLTAVPYKDYVTGRAERSMFDDFIGRYVDGGIGVTGTDRLFGFRVTDATSDSATVTFCDDQSKLHVTERATGEIIRQTPPPPADFVVTRAVVLTQGRWKVSVETGKEDKAGCDLDD